MLSGIAGVAAEAARADPRSRPAELLRSLSRARTYLEKNGAADAVMVMK
jgi:hypothetical protein